MNVHVRQIGRLPVPENGRTGNDYLSGLFRFYDHWLELCTVRRKCNAGFPVEPRCDHDPRTGFLYRFNPFPDRGKRRFFCSGIAVISFFTVHIVYRRAFLPVSGRTAGPHIPLKISQCLYVFRAKLFAINTDIIHSAVKKLSCLISGADPDPVQYRSLGCCKTLFRIPFPGIVKCNRFISGIVYHSHVNPAVFGRMTGPVVCPVRKSVFIFVIPLVISIQTVLAVCPAFVSFHGKNELRVVVALISFGRVFSNMRRDSRMDQFQRYPSCAGCGVQEHSNPGSVCVFPDLHVSELHPAGNRQRIQLSQVRS